MNSREVGETYIGKGQKPIFSTQCATKFLDPGPFIHDTILQLHGLVFVLYIHHVTVIQSLPEGET